jgi:hypothetical protein
MLSKVLDRGRTATMLVLAAVAVGLVAGSTAAASGSRSAAVATGALHHRVLHLRRVRLVHPFAATRHRSRTPTHRRSRSRVGRSHTVAHTAAAFVDGGSFTGVSEGSCCVDPPGINGAVSTSQFVQVDARSVSVFNRTSGALIKKTSVPSFCGLSSAAQARIVYDRPMDRWYLIGLTAHAVCVAASATGDATGGWYVTGLGALLPPGGFALNPTIGYDQDALLFTYDAYSSGGVYASTYIVAANKALAVAGRGILVIGWGPSPVPVVPPIVDDLSSVSDYFVGAAASGSSLTLYQGTALDRLDGQVVPTSVPVPAYTAPPSAAQPGTADTLNAGNASFQGPSTQIGDSLFNLHGIAVNGHPGIRWYQIDTASSTVANYGRVSDSSTTDDFDPSMAAASINGALTEFFTWTSTDTRNAKPADQHAPEMALATRATGDPLNVTRAAHSGPGSNYAPASGDNGWGFSQVSIDPNATSGCPAGSRAFAIGALGQTTQLWRARIWRFGLC